MCLANSSISFDVPLRLLIEPTTFSHYLAKMLYLNNKKGNGIVLSPFTILGGTPPWIPIIGFR
jgi:hypothetical protein